jgi:hypothetical protein
MSGGSYQVPDDDWVQKQGQKKKKKNQKTNQ